MHIPDLIISILFIILGTRGLVRGFIKESTFSVEVVVMFFLIYYKTEDFIILLRPLLGDLNYIAGILIFFLVIHLIFLFLVALIEYLIDKLNLKNFNRVLGCFLGVVKGIVIIYIFLYLLEIQNFVKKDFFYKNSNIIPYLIQNTQKFKPHWINL